MSGVAIARFGPAAAAARRRGRSRARATIIGAGVQGAAISRSSVTSLPGVAVTIVDRHPERAEALAEAARATAGYRAPRSCPSDARDATARADVVITAASFTDPAHRQVMDAPWLAPDALVVPVDYATMCAASVARDAALFLVDDRGQFLANREAGQFDDYPDPTATLGEAILDGTIRPASGRVVVTHLGVGLADVVFADAIVRRAEAAGLGTRLAGLTMRALRNVVSRCSSSCSSSSAGVGALAWVTGRALPQTPGTVAIPGLDGTGDRPARPERRRPDQRPTPHDLFIAQGYVHAQERMWQMEVWRHISSGRLSELFGPGSIDDDRFIRTLGWRAAAERDLASLAPETRAVLDAYAAGVNAWLDTHRDQLGLAFVVTGANPEPWTALDTLAWGKVQAWNLGGNMTSELFRYLADARLGDPARTDELFPTREFGPVIVPGQRRRAATAASAEAERRRRRGRARRPSGLTDDQLDAWADVGRLGSEALRSPA